LNVERIRAVIVLLLSGFLVVCDNIPCNFIKKGNPR
jgi:hypothetical protein